MIMQIISLFSMLKCSVKYKWLSRLGFASVVLIANFACKHVSNDRYANSHLSRFEFIEKSDGLRGFNVYLDVQTKQAPKATETVCEITGPVVFVAINNIASDTQSPFTGGKSGGNWTMPHGEVVPKQIYYIDSKNELIHICPLPESCSHFTISGSLDTVMAADIFILKLKSFLGEHEVFKNQAAFRN